MKKTRQSRHHIWSYLIGQTPMSSKMVLADMSYFAYHNIIHLSTAETIPIKLTISHLGTESDPKATVIEISMQYCPFLTRNSHHQFFMNKSLHHAFKIDNSGQKTQLQNVMDTVHMNETSHSPNQLSVFFN